ncbi:MAG: hypothetical protein JXB88_07770 [Spirochaetales bacterium]|nr:hypothetical protein [Spirochaetales bacterium]
MYEVNASIAVHDRAKAAREIEKLKALSPSHYLTLNAISVLAAYDANLPALLAVIDTSLEQFPGDPVLINMKMHCLSDMGRNAERLKILAGLCRKTEVNPVFWSAYACEMMKDGRKKEEALYWIKRTFRYLRTEAFTITLMGSLLWSEKKYKEANELFRFASCLEDKNESYTEQFFNASRYLKQTEQAIEFLVQRVKRYGKKSVDPAISLINAYRILEQTGNVFQVLEVHLQEHPDNGNLLAFAAHCYASYGRYRQAEEYLARAKGKTQDKTWLYTAAKLAGFKSEKKQAVVFWREIINIEPLSLEAHSTLAMLYGEIDGKSASYSYLEEICGRYPNHIGLHQLRISWLKNDRPETVETICNTLLGHYDNDAWVHFELAYSLFKQRHIDKSEQSIIKALAIDADNPDYLTLLGDIYEYQGKHANAQDAYKKALVIQVDTANAIFGLIKSCGNLEEKKEALVFIEQELIRQTVFGNRLTAFYQVAQRWLRPQPKSREAGNAL